MAEGVAVPPRRAAGKPLNGPGENCSGDRRWPRTTSELNSRISAGSVGSTLPLPIRHNPFHACRFGLPIIHTTHLSSGTTIFLRGTSTMK